MRHVLVTSIDIVLKDDPDVFSKMAKAVHEALKPFGRPHPTRGTVTVSTEFYVDVDLDTPEVRP